MTFRNAVLRTWQKQSRELSICNASMGLAGEAGELIDLIKKEIHHGHAIDVEKVKKEVGDVLYYLEVLCDYYGITQEECKDRVVAKLQARYPDGFSSEKSIKKDESKE